ncbi:hypothetical protein D3C77_278160 [compost metagenome]
MLGLALLDQVEQVAVENDEISRLARFDRADQLVLPNRAGTVDGVGIEHLFQGRRLLCVVGRLTGYGAGNAGGDVHERTRVA